MAPDKALRSLVVSSTIGMFISGLILLLLGFLAIRDELLAVCKNDGETSCVCDCDCPPPQAEKE